MRRLIRKWSGHRGCGKPVALIAQTATSGLLRVRGVPAGGYQVHPVEWLNEPARQRDEAEQHEDHRPWFCLVLRDGRERFIRAGTAVVAKRRARAAGHDVVAVQRID